jgi:hypothetical protein
MTTRQPQRPKGKAWRRHAIPAATQAGPAADFSGTCGVCGKKGYRSKQAAKRSARRRHPGLHMREYECRGDTGLWHITSQVPGKLPRVKRMTRWPLPGGTARYVVRCSCRRWHAVGTGGEVLAAAREHDDSPDGWHVVTMWGQVIEDEEEAG